MKLEEKLDPVEQYRFETLLKLGVQYDLASELCFKTDIVYQLRELLDAGCSLDLAIRICS